MPLCRTVRTSPRDVLHANPNNLPRPKENVGCPGCSCAGPLPGVALQRLWRGSALACAIVIILPLTWRKKPGCIQWEMQPSRCCCGRCSCLGSVYCCELVLPRSSLHGPTPPPLGVTPLLSQAWPAGVAGTGGAPVNDGRRQTALGPQHSSSSPGMPHTQSPPWVALHPTPDHAGCLTVLTEGRLA